MAAVSVPASLIKGVLCTGDATMLCIFRAPFNMLSSHILTCQWRCASYPFSREPLLSLFNSGVQSELNSPLSPLLPLSSYPLLFMFFLFFFLLLFLLLFLVFPSRQVCASGTIIRRWFPNSIRTWSPSPITTRCWFGLPKPTSMNKNSTITSHSLKKNTDTTLVRFYRRSPPYFHLDDPFPILKPTQKSSCLPFFLPYAIVLRCTFTRVMLLRVSLLCYVMSSI